ncbi:YfhD family protein [Paenibacillus roseipurpureus]|uniref:YfhD family protein n=1 Tax=Paenibacillus roseopurpureus TaxID=2918901 RepID=A0AA96LSF6_9BACL|nr:YfhD family protein [Paenibacillus sp. MBLB1832]WNR46362.1 YfhD family protein [Paenibacillus sp. MBLB1832]
MSNPNNQANRNLPVAKQEDVEFSSEVADRDDFEAAERAEAADQRQENQ